MKNKSEMNNFNNELNSRAKDLENVLEEILKIENAPDKLVESLRYAVLAGGKRLRSFLLIEVADFYKVNRKNSLMVAAAIELIHAYSLIHDDLPALDDDDLRRNKPSTHIKFDEATAILAGDALQSLAFQILSSSFVRLNKNTQIELINLLSKRIGPEGMVGGQIKDLSSRENTFSFENLKQMHRMKTALLISFSCEAGAIIGLAKEQEKKAFREYGEYLGMAFQIIDDVLDLTGDKKLIGKNLGSDKSNNSMTYLKAMGKEKSYEEAEKYCEKALSSLDIFEKLPENFKSVLGFVRSRKF